MSGKRKPRIVPIANDGTIQNDNFIINIPTTEVFNIVESEPQLPRTFTDDDESLSEEEEDIIIKPNEFSEYIKFEFINAYISIININTPMRYKYRIAFDIICKKNKNIKIAQLSINDIHYFINRYKNELMLASTFYSKIINKHDSDYGCYFKISHFSTIKKTYMLKVMFVPCTTDIDNIIKKQFDDLDKNKKMKVFNFDDPTMNKDDINLLILNRAMRYITWNEDDYKNYILHGIDIKKYDMEWKAIKCNIRDAYDAEIRMARSILNELSKHQPILQKNNPDVNGETGEKIDKKKYRLDVRFVMNAKI